MMIHPQFQELMVQSEQAKGSIHISHYKQISRLKTNIMSVKKSMGSKVVKTSQLLQFIMHKDLHSLF